jgi:hypothetical protein
MAGILRVYSLLNDLPFFGKIKFYTLLRFRFLLKTLRNNKKILEASVTPTTDESLEHMDTSQKKTTEKWLQKAEKCELAQALTRLAQLNQSKV